MRNKDWQKFSREIFELQNKIRMNPNSFIKTLEKSVKRFKKHILMSEDGTSGMETSEGPSAYYEAINCLKTQKALPPFKYSIQLEKAAQDHINDIGPKGMTSSIGSGKNSLIIHLISQMDRCQRIDLTDIA